MNCWWYLENDYVAVYTEDSKIAKKLDIKLMGTYAQLKDGKVFGYQFRVEKNDKDYKKLFDSLDLTLKDEYKVKGQRKKTSEGNTAKGKKRGKKEILV